MAGSALVWSQKWEIPYHNCPAVAHNYASASTCTPSKYRPGNTLFWKLDCKIPRVLNDITASRASVLEVPAVSDVQTENFPSVHRLTDYLARQAELRPDACAIVSNTRTFTYRQLDEASNRLASALKAAGCSRGDRVALLLPKSIEALVAMFATLKADCIYVPMDTSSPAARLERILRVSESSCVLAVRSTAAVLEEIAHAAAFADQVSVGWMDEGSAESRETRTAFRWSDVEKESAEPVDTLNKDSDPAHILFTSGSTGLPKGVVITHSNVIHFVEWANKYFGLRPTDRISGHPPLHFDLSTYDVYGTVAAGAQIHLVPPELNLMPQKLAAFIRDRKLTQWFSVPSVLNYMARFDVIQWDDFPDLRRLLWCGEKFPTPGLIHWMQRLPQVEFFNLYGPTEATIASSCFHVASCPESETAEISIGGPCEGETLLVLNDQLQPVAVGETGDLFIGGVGLSPGYWRDPEKTAQVFLKNPAAGPNSPERIYKTGDLAKVGDDGLIYLLGRSDSQIKSRGYRIELGEIEAAAHAIPGVQEAAVVAIEVPGFEGMAICCAFVPAEESMSALTLKEKLGKAVPKYMIPAYWMALDKMPRNGNGKADRPWLKEEFRKRQGESKQGETKAASETPLGAPPYGAMGGLAGNTVASRGTV